MIKRLINKVLYGNPYRPSAPDDFILRLRSSVIGEGMLHPGNVWLMEQSIQKMPEGGCVLEIGSYGGLSANLLTYLLDKHRREARLFCCDAWIYEGYHDQKGRIGDWMDGRGDVLRTDFMAYIKDSFVRAARLLSAQRLPHACHMRSDDFFDAWMNRAVVTDVFGRETVLGGAISFAYIDGNHAYDFAARDFENVSTHLLPGGYVLLDDSADHLPFGSARLAGELRNRDGFETVASNPNYLFRKK